MLTINYFKTVKSNNNLVLLLNLSKFLYRITISIYFLFVFTYNTAKESLAVVSSAVISILSLNRMIKNTGKSNIDYNIFVLLQVESIKKVCK